MMKKHSRNPDYIVVILFILLLACLPHSVFGQNILEVKKLIDSDRILYDRFGYSVSISGDYAFVASASEDEDANNGDTKSGAGSVFIYERDESGVWQEVQKIVPSDRADGDFFGSAVSVSGNYAIVGAASEDHDIAGANFLSRAGSAYIFERDGSGVWQEVQKIVASSRSGDDRFGHAVSMSGDYAIVTAFLEDEDSNESNFVSDAGSAYIFERDGVGVWSQVAKLDASDRAVDDWYGWSASISGNYAVVGTYQEDEDVAGGNTLLASGSAYIYERTGGVWSEVQKVVASDRALDDNFGISVSVSGNTVFVGSRFEDEDNSGANTISKAGSVYVFERDEFGVWVQAQKLVALDRYSSNQFGNDLALSGDYAIIGSYLDSDDAEGVHVSRAGSAYIFEKNTNGIWIEVQKIVASDRAHHRLFAEKVAISGDYFLVGAQNEDRDLDGNNSLTLAGGAYMYERPEVAFESGVWTGGSGVSGEPTMADSLKSFTINSGSATLSSEAYVNSITVAQGASLIVEASATLKTRKKTTINGAEALVIKSNASGTGNFIDAGMTYENAGTVKVERYFDTSVVGLSGGGPYHYMASPINGHAKFTDMTDLYSYREMDLSWIHHNDGIEGFANYNNAQGYAIRYGANITKSFIGEINTGDYSIALTATDHGGDPFQHYNLVANPYPSSISADALVEANNSVIEGNLYFWNGVDYAVYNTTMDAGTAGAIGATPDGNIAVGQGFFVEAIIADNLVFNNTMRGNDSDIYYKKESYPQVRLMLYTGEEKSDLLLTGHQAATYDSDAYDAKHIDGFSGLSLTSVLEEKTYDIQSVPELNNHVFDLAVYTDQSKRVVFQLGEQLLLDGKQLYLEDTMLGISTNISKENYETRLEAGEDKQRFKLRIEETDKAIRMWMNADVANVYAGDEQIQGVFTLLSLDGKILSVNKSNKIPVWNGLSAGVYVLKFQNKTNQLVQKIVKN